MSLDAPDTFVHRLRVRWAEVDAQQVVFNGHYLTYADVAVTEFWRSVGLPYPDAFRHLGGDLFVRKQTLAYDAPARLDDWLDVAMRCTRIGRSSITLDWRISSQGRALVHGETVYVYTALADGRPTACPEPLRRQIEDQAQGRSPWRLDCGPWSALQPAAAEVRRAVFIDEQGIDEAEEWDEADDQALHAVVCNLAGLPVATGRLIHAGMPPGEAKIGRMAVRRSARGIGLGAQVLRALIEAARGRGVRHISLSAQISARAFYTRYGFVAEGDLYDEVGIPHQRMTLTL
jgi:YbgC/YbaW family acyl-CoA thioester hydrolase